MDRSGRRRRLVTALGAAFGVLLIAGGALLIAGLLGSSPVPLPGLPENGQGMIQRSNTNGDGVAPVPGATTPAGHSTASVRPRATTATTTVETPTTAATTKPGNRPTSHPGNPKPTRTK